ncbi:MAG: amidohydrolase family protein [Candidatus Acidiferrales bacterium]
MNIVMKSSSTLLVRMLPAAVLLFSTGALAQTPTARAAGAKDEAIPDLRDARVVVLRHLRIIDGTGAPAKEDQTLVIEAGKIRALGSSAAIKVPEGARTIDLAGRTALPGLVMLHEHLFAWDEDSPGLAHPQHFSYPRLNLAFGVTTIRTAGTDFPYMDRNLKRRIDAGAVLGPEIHLTSPFLSGEDDPFLGTKIVRDAEDARRAVRYWAAEGFTSFKVHEWISKDALAAILDEAHRLKLPVTAHLRSVTCREAAEMGIDNLEHGLGPCLTADGLEEGPNGPKARALIQTLVERKVVLTATPIRGWQPLSDLGRELLDPSARDRYLRALSAHPARTTSPDPAPHGQLLLAFARAGGRLVLGSDPGCCGAGRVAGSPLTKR